MSALRERALWCDEEISECFTQLTALLETGAHFWRHHAFQYLRLPWEAQCAQLSQALRALTLPAAERLARDDEPLREFLARYFSLFAQLSAACAIGRFDVSALADVEPRDMPGRKWQQIRHFAPCIPKNDFSVLEWCAGKAHLGRVLARERGCAVTALEYNAELVEAGRQLANRERTAVNFQCVDVMSDHAAAAIHPHRNAAALHACGDLHARLLKVCVHNRAATVTLAPCCYHLTQSESHYALSRAAAQSGLRLRREDLRTAVHGSATISALENRRRQQLQAWRLGFDLLQRDLRGSDEYLPTPSLPVTALKEGFAGFCRKIAAMKRIELPACVDYAHYEHAGEWRLREVTALDLPRIAFRRALELWLVLDRALYLQENGYRVAVGEFCAPALTPRNLLIRAVM